MKSKLKENVQIAKILRSKQMKILKMTINAEGWEMKMTLTMDHSLLES